MAGPISLGHVDVVSLGDLRELASGVGPCVSAFMPTARHGPETLEAPVRLENLLHQVGGELDASGVDGSGVDGLIDPLRELVEDAAFWQHQADGLALYASADLHRRYRVPLSFAESAVVGSRFRLLPLLQLVAGDDTFFIVSLSQNQVRVFEATRQTIGELALGPVSGSLAEALAHEDPERQLQSRSVGGSDVRFHGHGAGGEIDKAELERYFRAVDNGLQSLIGQTRQPVVLACVDYYLPIYQSVTKLANLAEAVVAGNPEHRTPDELLAGARAIVDPIHNAHREATADRFGALAGTGKALTALPEIVAAAREGRVEALLVRVDAADPSAQPLPVDMGALIDQAVADVIGKGGTLESVEHPALAETPIAAILRY